MNYIRAILVIGFFCLFVACAIDLSMKRPNSAYFHTVKLDDGRVRVTCDNGGDATIEPGDQFGSIIVSCGTR